MELRDVVTALRTGWWLPIAGAALGGATGLALSLLQTPIYTSSTELFVSTSGPTSPSDILPASQFSQQRVLSYARLIAGPELAQQVVDRLGLPMSAQELSREIVATPTTDTVLIDVAVNDPSPQQAQRIATVIGPTFVGMANQLEATGPGGASTVKVSVTESPQLPTAPSSPATKLNTGLGLLAGLFLGSALALARARLDRTVKDVGEARELAEAPVLGTVRNDKGLSRHLTTDRGVCRWAAEDYRQLRTNLQFLSKDDPPKVIVVSSARPSEGRTTVTVNLAIALAGVGRRVTVLDADLRRPKVSRLMRLTGDVGLTNVLTDTASIDDVIQPYRQGLSVIAAGPTPRDPGDVLASSQMAAVLEKLRHHNDYVFINAPPLLSVADAIALATLADGVLLAVRYGSTRREELQEASARLQSVGATVLGVVVSCVPPRAQTTLAYANSRYATATNGRYEHPTGAAASRIS